ncbi:flagellin, partial [Bradyrhizobium japonicum]
MSSLLTNSTAMTALQTLRSVGSQLSTTQTRISTGQRVATASDNAAYWSIATSMRSDNAALSAVSDSLGLSAATVDTQYTALTTVLGDKDSGLTKLQSLLVQAKTAGIDRTKIQADVTQIQQQMKSTADSATFNGINWLSINTSATPAATPTSFNLVSSYSRVGGTPTIGSITVTTANFALYTTGGASPTGILDTTVAPPAGGPTPAPAAAS